MKSIAERVAEGDNRSVARMISMVENGDPAAAAEMAVIHKNAGRAHVIGVTGVMGAGKSTLISEMAREIRSRGQTVGIIAIDPTSPFSGGALLGDRIRMMELATDKGIFIRSMGTRGMLGGLAGAVYDSVEILDASGKDVVIVETVGVGQAEVDVIKIADTTLVVVVPGLGDAIQTIKAGLMEIADIFVVNKADIPGVERTIAELESLVEIISPDGVCRTPIIPVKSKIGEGIDRLVDEVRAHKEAMERESTLSATRRKRYEAELVEVIRRRLMSMVFDEEIFHQKVESVLEDIEMKRMDPYSAADEILDNILK